MEESITKIQMKSKPKTLILDTTKYNDIKEKPYVTKVVDSSIALLDSPEDDVVLEALLHLSKYVDLQVKNLNFSQQRALLHKLLNLFNRNPCILRLVLRLLGVLLTIEDVMVEIDQDLYDDKILKISHMYTTHTDTHIQHFCVAILSKLAESCRITCLIFKTDLINPILETIQKTKDLLLLGCTLELFYKLLNAPAAIGILPEMYNFDISILLMHLENPASKIAHISYEVIRKLTNYCVEVFQKMFREAKLIEYMLEVVMSPAKEEYHELALDIVCNSLRSEETSNYFIESLEFLKFCQWVKTCEARYLLPGIVILEHLTSIPSRRQILFDLSVEESILYFLRSTQRDVLSKTCEAISNMTTHKYCCERMLTPVVLKELLSMLNKKDAEQAGSDVALKTILNFSRRNLKTLDMIYTYDGHKTLLNYVIKSNISVPEESFLAVLEILYKMALNPLYQKDILDILSFEKLLYFFQTASANISSFVCEILSNFVSCAKFRKTFLSVNGPQLVVGALQTSTDRNLLKNVLVFIYNALIYEDLVKNLLLNNLVRVLKEFPLKSKAPFVDNILKQVYNFHLPLKLFEIKRLTMTDKLPNKFYLINGTWKAPFPFLEILEATQVSTIYTIYVVDYSFEIFESREAHSFTSEGMILLENIPSERSLTVTMSRVCVDAFQINYGKLSPDIFLPRYIYHFAKNTQGISAMEEKLKLLAEYVDTLLSGPKEEFNLEEKIRCFRTHVKALKLKLGTNLIPIGYLKLGFHCERALLFKAIADKCNIPTSLVKGNTKLYWNEVALINLENKYDTLKLYVVDLMDNVGSLLLVGSRAANKYCNLEA